MSAPKTSKKARARARSRAARKGWETRRARLAELERDRAKRAQARKLARTKLLDALRAPEIGIEALVVGMPGKAEKRFSYADAATWTKLSESTIRRYVERGGTPPAVVDIIRAKLTNERAYASTWSHGTRSAPTKREERLARKAFKEFIVARDLNDPKTQKKYERWRAIKDYLRPRLTAKAWTLLVRRLGKRESLSQFGSFSVQRFITS